MIRIDWLIYPYGTLLVSLIRFKLDYVSGERLLCDLLSIVWLRYFDISIIDVKFTVHADVCIGLWQIADKYHFIRNLTTVNIWRIFRW